MDWLALVVAITGLLGVIYNIYKAKQKAALDKQKAILDGSELTQRQQKQRVELDNLEHKMVIEIAERYREFAREYDAKILKLQEEIKSYKMSLEEAEIENRQLLQTNTLYEERIKFLEDSLDTLHKKYKLDTAALKERLNEQNNKIDELEERLNGK